MNIALTPTPTRAIRSVTDTVRRLRDRQQNAWNIYQSQLARAAAEYHERFRRIAKEFAGEESGPNGQAEPSEAITPSP